MASFASSYIPTKGTTVTRAADVADISGNNFGTTNLLTYSEEFDQAAWSVTGSTITPNVESAPNSTLTADKHTHTGGGPRITRFSAATVAANADFTFSFYAKAGTSSYAACSIYDGTTTGKRFWFNLTTGLPGSITNIGAGYPSASSNMQSVGNGWYRCIATITNGSNTTVNVDGISVCLNQDGILTPSVSGLYGYIWGAQLEQSDVATPYVKSNVTWNSRASNATYYDSTGTIRKSSYNELLRSEEFDNAVWSSVGGTVTRNSNVTAAPDGTLTADELVFPSADVGIAQGVTIVSGIPYTVSIWIKGTAGETIRFTANGIPVPVGTPSNVTLTGDWVKYSFTNTSNSTSGSLNISTYGGATARNIYVWGAQLEKGTYAGDYAKTEATAASTARNAAYLPDDNGNFVSAGPLLLEEQRTNLVTDSLLTTGGGLYASTISSTTETNPEGIDFCRRLLSNAGGNLSGHRVYVPASSGNNITVSAFVKKDTHRYVYIGFGGGTNSFTALFDIDPTVTGDRLLGQGGVGTRTNIDAGYQNFPNGWVRIWAVGTTSGVEGTTIGFSPNDYTFNISNWNAAGTEAFFIHGVQYEDNVTFPSSYIPTYGIAATRSADVSTSTSGFGNSWYRQDEGTVFTRFNSYPQEGSTLFCWSLYEDTPNYLGLRSATGYTPDRITNLSRVSNSNEFSGEGDANGYITAPANDARNAFAYMTDDFGVSWNGGTSFSSSSGAIPAAPSKFTIGTNNGVNHLNGTIRRLCYWNQRLPNSTLSTITQ